MIILIRLRNLAIFALAVLSVSFIYIGYTGFGSSGENFEPTIGLSERQEEQIDMVESVASESLEVVSLSKDEGENFFAEFRITRDRARAQQIENLKENINNPKSTQETINKAQDMLFVISNNIALEAHTENLLQTKGYEDSAVFIEDKNISVFVKNENLKEDDITRIGDLVVRATGCGLEQLVITPKN